MKLDEGMNYFLTIFLYIKSNEFIYTWKIFNVFKGIDILILTDFGSNFLFSILTFIADVKEFEVHNA